VQVQTKAAVYGIAGLGLAGLLIFSGSTLGLLNLGSTGAISILITDPPSVPDGVTAVFVTYSDVAVHAAGLPDPGWVVVAGEGTFNSLDLVNLSQTISAGTIPSLSYNLVAFNITGVQVEFDGKNYSATVNSGRLVVPIVGGLKVSSSDPAAALVDIQPTVLNVGNQTNPDFVMATGARALQVPSGEFKGMLRIGDRLSLMGRGWFNNFAVNRTGSLDITGLSLTSSSFSFSAANHGSDPLTLRLVFLSPASGSQAGIASIHMGNSVMFLVRPDGSLQLASWSPGEGMSMMGSSGFTFAAGASQTFSFSGAVSTFLGAQGISPGTVYNVVFLDSGSPVVESVTAA
jgi:hypothetical protein